MDEWFQRIDQSNVCFHRSLSAEVENAEGWSRYFQNGVQAPTNQALVRHVTSSCAGRCLHLTIEGVLKQVPRDNWPNWAVSSQPVNTGFSELDPLSCTLGRF